MSVRTRVLVATAIGGLALLAVAVSPLRGDGRSAKVESVNPVDVLAFSKTTGFRHDSITAALAALRRFAAEGRFRLVTTDDAGAFTDRRLARFEVVAFVLTTGDVLDAAQQRAFERYVRRGGGYVGIHSASDTEYDWPFYGRLVGAYFRNHPAIQAARVVVDDRSHPSTASLPRSWTRTDEWYNFRSPPPPSLKVLVRVDERTYSGGTMGVRHPITWCHDDLGGRAWYTAMGHTAASYRDGRFLGHLLGGLRWAAGTGAAC
jgi:type 1 glutamine amidotransferase